MTALLSAESWQYRALNAKNPGLDFLSDALLELVAEGHPVIAGSADLQYSNGLNKFAHAHPDRYIQFGISEQNMVTAAAGLATTGHMPFVATFASFLFLLPAQAYANRVNAVAAPAHDRNARFTAWNWAGIALGSVFFALVIVGLFYPESP